ncbi:MarR family transcriptional regulator, partial [Klebsiella pneumoniae]|nr:MarR family transcriptional regulator [Klebsiella pneumoniae]
MEHRPPHLRPVPEPVRQSGLRDHNLAVVLRRVANAQEPVSRADLAVETGLTRATVSSLVDTLVEGGLLTELEPRSG